MKQTEIVDHRKVGQGYTWAQLRPISEQLFVVNSSSDATENFIQPFASDYAYHSDDIPTIYTFQINKNNNPTATKDNCLVDLKIPILPVAWNTDSEQDWFDFVKNAKTREIIQNSCENMPKNEANRRINRKTIEAYNYIKFSIAKKYLSLVSEIHSIENELDKLQDKPSKTKEDVAKANKLIRKYKDLANSAKMLKNLDIMKDFEYDDFAKALGGNPNYLVFKNPNFAATYELYDNACRTYPKILNVLDNYRKFDVRQELANGPTFEDRKETQPGE